MPLRQPIEGVIFEKILVSQKFDKKYRFDWERRLLSSGSRVKRGTHKHVVNCSRQKKKAIASIVGVAQ